MNDNTNPNISGHRVCPFCAENIKREAKICPRCRQWLTLKSIRNPAVAVWVYGIPHLALYGLVGFFLLRGLSRIINPEPNYSAFLNSLRVVESHLNVAETANGPRIYVTGILT